MILPRFGIRYLLRHRWQTALMVLGIALGVAVMVAIDLANSSASRAFDLSTAAVAGRATHQIIGSGEGIPQSLYSQLRRDLPQLRALAPVINQYVTLPNPNGEGGSLFTLLGIDPFAEAPFRDYLGGETIPLNQLTAFLTQPGSVLLARSVAQQYNLQPCTAIPLTQDCAFTLLIQNQPQTVYLVGILEPADNLSARALENLILTDIATAQELTGKQGWFDRLDVILPPTEELAGADGLSATLQSFLPPGVTLQPVAARSGSITQMTAAFRINLTALSLLALLVGLFIIYNAVTFSVVQRRPLFGTLRCLGFTQAQIFGMVLGEAATIGLLGALMGVALGVLLGQGAVRLVTQTINDLFFVVNVRGVQIPPASLLKGFAAGLLATLLTAAAPAWEAASVPPRAALYRSGLEEKARRAVILAAIGGVLLSLLGWAILRIPTRDLILSFGGTFAVIVGLAMLTPAATAALMRLLTPILGKFGGLLARMAAGDVTKSLSRTAIATAALMVAVSVTIGVNLMVGSFRYTVQTWLQQTLQGDIYLSAPGLNATQAGAPLPPETIAALQNLPQARQVALLRNVSIQSARGEVALTAVSHYAETSPDIFLAAQSDPAALWQAMQRGESITLSEPLANRLNLTLGDTLELSTPQGARTFRVGGIFYDYGSPQGAIRMALGVYQALWQDESINAAALFLQPNTDPEALTRQLQRTLPGAAGLLIRSNRGLRDEALAVFDRTFAITGAMQLLSTLVAFIGILSALMALQLEKQRQIGILRALGLTARQLWALVNLQTGLLGASAGLLAMPTGYILALILVYIINKRSFGWTLQMQLTPEPFLLAFAVAVIAALLAGLYPARKMSQMLTAEALRGE
ncbi:MAG: FtsX-like permease family protein [Anaerolineales bacterium]